MNPERDWHFISRTALFFSIGMMICASLQAQDVQVRATVSADTVGIQDQLQFTVTVSGADSGEAEVARARFRDFQIMSGPDLSTQFQWINGRSSASKSISYVLLPRKEGDLVIESVLVSVRGREFRTEPIRIRVAAGSSGHRAPAAPDPFDMGQRSTGRVGPEDVLITAELDRSSAYAGQQVTLSYQLYTRVGVSGLQLQESPPLDGFWVEDLEVASNPPGTRRTIDGREYTGYLVKRQALFPTATGKLTVPAATFAISVKTPGDFFGFFSGSETVYRKNREVSLDVKPLPEQGRPQGFGNAVGSFNLTSSADKANAATGEAVSLRIRLEGRGNLKLIPDLVLPPLPEFTVFSSKRAENVRPFEAGVIGGDKTWDYVIVPRAPGRQSIPSLAFSYFDPQKERYETLTTAPIALSVVRGTNSGAGSGLAGIVKQDLTRQGSDINFIRLSAGDLEPARGPLYLSAWFYLLAAVPVAINLAVLVFNWERSKESGDLAWTRSRKARRTANARLKQALKDARREPRLFYDHAAAALSGYVSDRFGLPGIAVTGDSLERILGGKSIPPETITEITACLQECDFGRFVFASPSSENMRGLAARIVRLMDLMERAN